MISVILLNSLCIFSKWLNSVEALPNPIMVDEEWMIRQMQKQIGNIRKIVADIACREGIAIAMEQ